MAVRFVWDGLDELKAQLRALPSELVSEGGGIVELRATTAFQTIEDGYPSRAGTLKKDLTVTHSRSAFGAWSVVRNTSKEASWFEHGTQARHTKLGANRGSMPPNPIFTQTIMRERRGMYDDLADLLTRHGLRVTGVA